MHLHLSILQSLAGDNHISLTAIGEPEPDKTREMKVCVAKRGKLPIGDYLAQFLLLFANGLHLTEIHTLKTAAMRVTYPKGTRIPSRIAPLEAYWQPYYQAVIAQDTPHEERVAAALAHEHEHLRHIIIRLGGLDLDFEEQITYDELHLVLLDIFEQCVHTDVKRLIVRRLHACEDAYVRFLSAREAGHHDERLLRALDYAIERMQNDLDRF